MACQECEGKGKKEIVKENINFVLGEKYWCHVLEVLRRMRDMLRVRESVQTRNKM